MTLDPAAPAGIMGRLSGLQRSAMTAAAVKNGSATRLSRDFFVGEWLVRPSLGSVSRQGLSVHLEPKALDVLVCLARAAGAVVTKEELLQSVWPETFVTENV